MESRQEAKDVLEVERTEEAKTGKPPEAVDKMAMLILLERDLLLEWANRNRRNTRK